MANRVTKADPKLEALTEELIELRVTRVILRDAVRPDEAEIQRVTQRLDELAKQITEQRRMP